MTFQNKNIRSFKSSYKTLRKEQPHVTDVIKNPNRPKWLSLVPSQMNIVFFDLETTGGNPYNSSIIEIGAIKYNQGKEIGRFETLINPKRAIPNIVQKITKINNEMVMNAPTLKEIFNDFVNFIGDSIIVAHGAQGDIAYLSYYMKEFKNEEFKNYYFCTHLIVSNLLSEIPSKSLTGVADYFEIPVLEAHNAITDAQMTLNVFWKLIEICEKNGFKTCEDLLKLQADAETIRKLGPGINPSIIDNIPTTPGLLFILNSHHEISYLTASSNIKKSLQQLTEITFDKELNKIIVDASGFKFERYSNLLESLIQEKKQLKKISLLVDPRKNQSRSENFLQIFIPDDMLDFARLFPEKVPFLIPQHGELHIEDLNEEDVYIKKSRENSNLYVTFGEQDTTIVPITRTRRIANNAKSDKFKISRRRNNHDESILQVGHLKEGIGYCFGPFQQPKLVLTEAEEIIKMFPFQYNSFSMQERFEHLRVVISIFNGKIDEEISYLEKNNRKLNSIKNFSKWIRNLNLLKEIKSIYGSINLNITAHNPKSGLCVISNNDFKEFDVAIVVKGRVVKKLRLPFEQAEKLKSSRYFTRLFINYFDEIISPLSPIVFTDDICSDMELFSYWLQNKKGEGEWVDFFELEGLFNTSIL